MLRAAVLFLLIAHGLIHLMGSAKAFGWAEVAALTKPISRPMGALWLLATVLLCASALLLFVRQDGWWMLATAAVVLSQALIIGYGRDARFGTVANVLLLLAIVVAGASWNFRRGYVNAAAQAVQRSSAVPAHIVTEADLAPMPPPRAAVSARQRCRGQAAPAQHAPLFPRGDPQQGWPRGCPSPPCRRTPSARPLASSGWTLP